MCASQYSALFCVGGEWSHRKIECAQVAIILTTRWLPSILTVKFNCCQVCLFKHNFTTKFCSWILQRSQHLPLNVYCLLMQNKTCCFRIYTKIQKSSSLSFSLSAAAATVKKLCSRRLIHVDFCGEMSFCVSVNRVFVFAAIAVSEKGNRQPMSINNFIKNRFDAVARTNIGNDYIDSKWNRQRHKLKQITWKPIYMRKTYWFRWPQ